MFLCVLVNTASVFILFKHTLYFIFHYAAFLCVWKESKVGCTTWQREQTHNLQVRNNVLFYKQSVACWGEWFGKKITKQNKTKQARQFLGEGLFFYVAWRTFVTQLLLVGDAQTGREKDYFFILLGVKTIYSKEKEHNYTNHIFKISNKILELLFQIRFSINE